MVQGFEKLRTGFERGSGLKRDPLPSRIAQISSLECTIPAMYFI